MRDTSSSVSVAMRAWACAISPVHGRVFDAHGPDAHGAISSDRGGPAALSEEPLSSIYVPWSRSRAWACVQTVQRALLWTVTDRYEAARRRPRNRFEAPDTMDNCAWSPVDHAAGQRSHTQLPTSQRLNVGAAREKQHRKPEPDAGQAHHRGALRGVPAATG